MKYLPHPNPLYLIFTDKEILDIYLCSFRDIDKYDDFVEFLNRYSLYENDDILYFKEIFEEDKSKLFFSIVHKTLEGFVLTKLFSINKPGNILTTCFSGIYDPNFENINQVIKTFCLDVSQNEEFIKTHQTLAISLSRGTEDFSKILANYIDTNVGSSDDTEKEMSMGEMARVISMTRFLQPLEGRMGAIDIENFYESIKLKGTTLFNAILNSVQTKTSIDGINETFLTVLKIIDIKTNKNILEFLSTIEEIDIKKIPKILLRVLICDLIKIYLTVDNTIKYPKQIVDIIDKLLSISDLKSSNSIGFISSVNFYNQYKNNVYHENLSKIFKL